MAVLVEEVCRRLPFERDPELGRVVEVDARHEFPDGRDRPGALVKTTNAFAIWVPVEKLTNAMVVQ